MNETPKLTGISPQSSQSVVQQQSIPDELSPQRAPQRAPLVQPDVRRNGLEALHAKFQKLGPEYKQAFVDRRDTTTAKSSLAEMRRLVEARYREKNNQLKQLESKSWFLQSKLFGNLSLDAAKDEIEAISIVRTGIDNVENAITDFESKYERFQTLRSQPIPLDGEERAEFFKTLREAGKELFDARNNVALASRQLDDRLEYRRDHLKLTRSIFRRIGKNAPAYRSFNAQLQARDDYRNKILRVIEKKGVPRSIHDEVHRLDQLETQLNRVATGPNGQDNLKLILGDPSGNGPRLRFSVALNALAVGEPLSPYLKQTAPQSVIAGELRPIGVGKFNTVYRAKVRVNSPIGNEVLRDYAIKPLDAKISRKGGFGLEKAQVRVFARQRAAYEVSQSLGLDLVAKPEYIEIDGRLHLAMPLVKGYSPHEISSQLMKKYGRETYDRVMAGLHNNPKLQNTLKDVQLFQTVIGDKDGHRNNLKLQFLDSRGKEVSFEDLATMSNEESAKLDVKAGLYDLDLAFVHIHDHNPVFKKRERKIDGQPVDAFFPMRPHFIGPPPFHTVEDYHRIEQLEQNLANGDLAQNLPWSLTSDKYGHDEIGAMKSRVAGIKATMDEQYEAGRRLDVNGRVVDPSTNDPTGPPNQQKGMSDTADVTLTGYGGRYGYTHVRRSLMHKFFRLQPIEDRVDSDSEV
jgi:hypothetical protein